MKTLNKPFRAVQYPFHHLQVSPLKSKIDIAVGVTVRKDGLFYSSPFTKYTNVLITKKARGLKLDSLPDLIPLKLGAWKNAKTNLGADFANVIRKKGRSSYYEYPSQKDQVIAFFSGQIDVILIDESIFYWYKKQLSIPSDSEIETHYFFKEKYTHISFKSKELRDKFNTILLKIKKDGRFDRIHASVVRQAI